METDPLQVFAGLDPQVMGSITMLTMLMQFTAWPRWACVSIPLMLGALWGGLIVDWTWLNRAEVFSSVLLNSAGAVAVGRSIVWGIRSAADAMGKPNG